MDAVVESVLNSRNVGDGAVSDRAAGSGGGAAAHTPVRIMENTAAQVRRLRPGTSCCGDEFMAEARFFLHPVVFSALS